MILKINKIEYSKFLYTIFTYDYGIIKVGSKLNLCKTNKKHRWKPLDIWYMINFEISTMQWRSIHNIRNIQILSEFNFENKAFSKINNYLILLNTILKNVPVWVSNYEIFKIIEKINKKNDLDSIKYILATLKVLDISWWLSVDGADKNVNKILKFINSNNIDKILKLSWISDETESFLKTITL